MGAPELIPPTTAAGTGPVGGSGTAGTIPVWSSGTTLGNSHLTQTAGGVFSAQPFYINTASPRGQLTWDGTTLNTFVVSAMSGQSLSFGSNGVYDRIFLNTSGNVGIGTASPLVRLHLSQSASGTYGPVIFLSNSANTANDVTGIYGSPASGTALPYRGGITFAPGNTGRVRIHTGNNANPGDGICCTFDGANVSLNSANTAAIFDASGSQQGLKLPATPGNSNANTLDAYVDGGAGSGGATFTATLKGLVSDPTTPVTVTGQYVLVGKMLVMQIYFANVNTTGASGAIYVTTGLAAALRPAQNAIGSVSMESMGTITGTGVHAICNTAAELYIAQNNSNAASTFVTHNAGAARGMTITVSYIVP